MSAHAMIFNTFDLIKKFEKVGLDEKQAQVQAEAAELMLTKVLEYLEENAKQHVVATSQDVKQVETELSYRIGKLQHETELEKERIHSEFKLESEKIRAEIEKTRSDLTIEIKKVCSDLTVEIEKIRGEIYKVKSSLIMWMLGIWGGQTVLFVGLFGKALNLF